ncbi:N-acetyltransferase [Sesbania bispinosa]|nr:N-acetyltransferase [Sesbania bispinosa]
MEGVLTEYATIRAARRRGWRRTEVGGGTWGGCEYEGVMQRKGSNVKCGGFIFAKQRKEFKHD